MSCGLDSMTKHPGDGLPIIVTYVNEQGDVAYTITDLSVVVYNSESEDVTADAIDTDLQSWEGNQARPWLKEDGLEAGVYQVEVKATMETGEVLVKEITLNVVDA